MENNKTRIPAYDREPSPKSFRRSILISLVFIAFYGGFLIWKNYYKDGVTPPIDRQQLAVPSHMVDSTALEQDKAAN